jgi:hypothetical protein
VRHTKSHGKRLTLTCQTSARGMWPQGDNVIG